MMLVAWLLITLLTFLNRGADRCSNLWWGVRTYVLRTVLYIAGPLRQLTIQNVFHEAVDQSWSCKILESMTHIFSLYQADPTRSLVLLLSNGFSLDHPGKKAESRRGGYNNRYFVSLIREVYKVIENGYRVRFDDFFFLLGLAAGDRK